MEPLITTLIPTYQKARLLKRAITSVQNQTESRVRIHIFDNASEDETRDVVARMSAEDSRLVYHRQKQNIGAAANYLFAMQTVQTPFFSLFADDDLLKPDFYADALARLERHRESAFCGGLTEILANGRPVSVHPKELRDGLFQPAKAYAQIARNHITWTSILFRREVLDRVGLIDPETGLFVEQDYQFRIAFKFPIYFRSKVYAAWTSDSGNPMATALERNWNAALHVGLKQFSIQERSPEMRRHFCRWFDLNFGKWTRRLLTQAENAVTRHRELGAKLDECLARSSATEQTKRDIHHSLARASHPLLPPMKQIKAAVKRLRVFDPVFQIKQLRRRRREDK